MIVFTQVLPRFQTVNGTLLVVVAGRTSSTLPASQLRLSGGGGWSTLGSVSGDVPAAPGERELLVVNVPVGEYNGVALGDDVAFLRVTVAKDQVEPVLLGIDGGHIIAGAAYAGNDQVNLGLGELAGKFVPMPAFALQDQGGGTIDNVEIIRDLPDGLGEAARRAVQQWRFRPATLGGEPIDVYYTVTVNFRLQ